MCNPTFGFKDSQKNNLKNKFTKKNCCLDLYFPTRENFALPYTLPNLVPNFLSDRLWVPLLLGVERFLCGPKWLIKKMLARKGCDERMDAVIGRRGHVSHHLRSILFYFIFLAY